MVKAWLRAQKGMPGFTIPLPTPPPKKDEPATPAQPAPAPRRRPRRPATRTSTARSSTPGRPLDPSTRRAMEARFGYDFSGVRVHDDARAAATAAASTRLRSRSARTSSSAPGRSTRPAPSGRRLLAHELAHVVQQSTGGGGRAGDVPSIGRPLDPELREYFEPRLGVDLGAVRIHDDAEAAAAARERRAQAYTVGSHVVFGKGQYEPRHAARPLAARARARARRAGAARRRVDGTPAVERDASAAATASRAGPAARASSARRDASAVHLFGEPDNTSDLTFISTHGEPGFLQQATALPPDVGPRAAVASTRCRQLLATLAQSTGDDQPRSASSATRTSTTSSRRSSTAARPGSPSKTCLRGARATSRACGGIVREPDRHGPLRTRRSRASGRQPRRLRRARPSTPRTCRRRPGRPAPGCERRSRDDPRRARPSGGTADTLDTALTQELDALRPQVVHASQRRPTPVTDAQALALQNAITGLIVVDHDACTGPAASWPGSPGPAALSRTASARTSTRCARG